MTLRNITFSEHFCFDNLAQLKTWLDQFSTTDLTTVYFDDRLDFIYETEALSDGSEVNNIRVP